MAQLARADPRRRLQRKRLAHGLAETSGLRLLHDRQRGRRLALDRYYDVAYMEELAQQKEVTGEDMILILAKAADCSWSTVRELLQMYAAKRRLQADDLGRLCERYQKLGRETARSIVSFYKKRIELRAQKCTQGEFAAQ